MPSTSDRKISELTTTVQEMGRQLDDLRRDAQAAPVIWLGCICPPTSELTCAGLMCPRRAPTGMIRGLTDAQS